MATVHVAGAVPTPPVRVVVVAATLARARQLERLLAAPGFAVVGVARGAEESERLVAQATPAAVLIDLDLPSGGLDAIERIMATRATPIVVVGDAAGQPEAALAAGAVDVVGPLDVPPGAPDYAEALRRHLTMASRVPVITHPRARLRARSARRGEQAAAVPEPASTESAAAAAASTNGAAPAAAQPSVSTPLHAANGSEHHARASARRARPVVVAIGASTGGPPALATILRELPGGPGRRGPGRPAHGGRVPRRAGPLAGRGLPAGRARRRRRRPVAARASSTWLRPAATCCCARATGSSSPSRPSASSTCPGVDSTFHSRRPGLRPARSRRPAHRDGPRRRGRAARDARRRRRHHRAGRVDQRRVRACRPRRGR